MFEVASVKVSHSATTDVGGMRASKGALSIVNAPLREDRRSRVWHQRGSRWYLIDGPEWLRTELYDIGATFAEETWPDVMRLMLQALLRERFDMCFHRENRNVPSYASGGKERIESEAEAVAGAILRLPKKYGSSCKRLGNDVYARGQAGSTGRIVRSSTSPEFRALMQ